MCSYHITWHQKKCQKSAGKIWSRSRLASATHLRRCHSGGHHLPQPRACHHTSGTKWHSLMPLDHSHHCQNLTSLQFPSLCNSSSTYPKLKKKKKKAPFSFQKFMSICGNSASHHWHNNKATPSSDELLQYHWHSKTTLSVI